MFLHVTAYTATRVEPSGPRTRMGRHVKNDAWLVARSTKRPAQQDGPVCKKRRPSMCKWRLPQLAILPRLLLLAGSGSMHSCTLGAYCHVFCSTVILWRLARGPLLPLNLVAAHSVCISRPNHLLRFALAELWRGRQSTCRCRPACWLIFLGFVEGLCVGIAPSQSLAEFSLTLGLRPFAVIGWSSMHLA